MVLHALSNCHIMNKPHSHHNVCIFLRYGIEHKKDINAKILNKSPSHIKACDLFRTHSIFLPSSFSTSPTQPSLTPTDLFPSTTSSAPQESTTTSLSTSPESWQTIIGAQLTANATPSWHWPLYFFRRGYYSVSNPHSKTCRKIWICFWPCLFSLFSLSASIHNIQSLKPTRKSHLFLSGNRLWLKN